MSILYQTAVNLLRSRLRGSKPIKNTPNVLNMKEWLLELGYEDPNVLNVIHITGTKGKGSTAAYTDALIRTHFHRLSRRIKVGLYTSPHLRTERERIRINFQPISEELFATTFFEVWNTLSKTRSDNQMPGYLQLIALQSLLVFIKESVDVAIYEVHAGGRKDATNIFDRPLVCGFTTIGLDHTDLLGNTIQSIAWHKSGIMKPGRRAFSITQSEVEAREVLQTEANIIDCPLEFIKINAGLPNNPALKSSTQKENISLAIQLADTYLSSESMRLSAEDIVDGITLNKWPGRFQEIKKGNNSWLLDCAHNTLSIPVALSWFISEVQSNISEQNKECQRILIFGHESARNAKDLISLIERICSHEKFQFDQIILSPYERYGKLIHQSTAINDHFEFWQGINPLTKLSCTASLKRAIGIVEDTGCQKACYILITGSSYLVGEALSLLECKQ